MGQDKYGKDWVIQLPPRHARGCPKNVMRSVIWQLKTCELTPEKRAEILGTLQNVLPCLCPKSGG